MQGVLVAAKRQGLSVRLKLLLWPSLLMYMLQLYTDIDMVANHWGLESTVAVMLLVAACLQAAAVAGAVICESVR